MFHNQSFEESSGYSTCALARVGDNQITADKAAAGSLEEKTGSRLAASADLSKSEAFLHAAQISTDTTALRLLKPGETTHETIDIDGQERHYNLHLPKGYDGKEPLPVVLVFNGWGNKPNQGNLPAGADGMEPVTGFSEKADKDKFIVVYMDGNEKIDRSWNNGQWWFSKENDLKFVDSVLSGLERDLNVDKSRYYLSGFSQGASFAHRLANAMPERFAALASVGGWLTGKEEKEAERADVKPAVSSISILQMHSTDDKVAPFDGRNWWLKMKTPVEMMEYYRKHDGISTPTVLESSIANNGTNRIDHISVNRATGAEVHLIQLEGAGHIWFGGPGTSNSPISATDETWNFFKRHKLQK